MDFQITVLRGDLTATKADAIVNPSNSYGLMGGGVALAMKLAGGQRIENEALACAPIPIGKAVHTTAGLMPAIWVIHSPTMVEPAQITSPENVHLAARAALEDADRLGAETVAFPGMGTGVGGVPFGHAARAMVSAFREVHVRNVKRLLLVASGPELERAFRDAVEESQPI